ncbi:DUF3253 domain-containing protein [Lysobacter humi (ex Lee et al. 2017)]
MASGRDIADAIVALLASRAPPASICPSEVARALDADGWRDAMPQVRAVALVLAADDCIRVTQGQDDVPLDSIATVRGPIRLRRGPRFPSGADPTAPATPRGGATR